MDVSYRIGIALIALLVPMSVLAGPKKITVIVNSIPAGAHLYDGNGTYLGQTPTIITVTIPNKTECLANPDVRALWTSGASLTDTLTICRAQGKKQTYALERPDAPNLLTDLRVATDLLTARAAEAAAKEAQWTAVALGISASIQQAANAYTQALYAYRPVTCSTNRIGTYSTTSCY